MLLLQAETRGRGQALSSVSGEQEGGSFGDFIGGDLPKKLAILLVRRCGLRSAASRAASASRQARTRAGANESFVASSMLHRA